MLTMKEINLCGYISFNKPNWSIQIFIIGIFEALLAQVTTKNVLAGWIKKKIVGPMAVHGMHMISHGYCHSRYLCGVYFGDYLGGCIPDALL
jgi:hypothetical protein